MKMIRFIILIFQLSSCAALIVCPMGNFYNDEGIPYNLETQQCCQGTVVDRSYDYIRCCGNSTFDIMNEICCGGTSQLRVYGFETRCCGDQIYKSKRQACCADSIIPIPSDSYNKTLRCCGNKLMDAKISMCCGDNIIPGVGTSRSLSCCGNITYDLAKEICCYFQGSPLVIQVSSSETDCCNGEAYDKSKNLCCTFSKNGTFSEVLKPKQNDSMECCEDEIYNSETQSCCDDKVINGDQLCCDEDVKNITIVTKKNWNDIACCNGETYSLDLAICCKGKLNDLPESNYVKDSFICCGDKVLNVRDQDCCVETPFNFQTQHCCYDTEDDSPKVVYGNGCCGDKGYNISTQICCGKKLYMQDEKFSRRCCGENVYDINEMCCGGQIIPLSEGQTGCCTPYMNGYYPYYPCSLIL